MGEIRKNVKPIERHINTKKAISKGLKDTSSHTQETTKQKKHLKSICPHWCAFKPYWGECKPIGRMCSTKRATSMFHGCPVYLKDLERQADGCLVCNTCQLNIVSGRDEYLNPPSIEEFLQMRWFESLASEYKRIFWLFRWLNYVLGFKWIKIKWKEKKKDSVKED